MPSPHQFSKMMCSSLDELSVLIEQVRDWGTSCALPDRALWTLCLILDELITNSIVHGYRNAPDRPIEVAIERDGGLIRLQLTDFAPAFNPLTLPASLPGGDIEERQIGGLGIHFVRKMSASLDYDYVDAGNRIRLAINITPDGEARGA
ncbi:ATP-binding protein [Noviherbaspirillum sp. CPCC 100848]|uniref:ATP-binding protein n=1 Tax=Noviherbaspirillum album TaxID=3080276 RepID=A0ABU6JAS7_9BURK|nr:ATP-binding protein [Noviherbaspirillum sp. CPCC 100848]MEC4720743.1 ATP-binding protein [Noviherbaspirillum sp. CPCC 100848]